MGTRTLLNVTIETSAGTSRARFRKWIIVERDDTFLAHFSRRVSEVLGRDYPRQNYEARREHPLKICSFVLAPKLVVFDFNDSWYTGGNGFEAK
jgi:hypothetical protein